MVSAPATLRARLMRWPTTRDKREASWSAAALCRFSMKERSFKQLVQIVKPSPFVLGCCLAFAAILVGRAEDSQKLTMPPTFSESPLGRPSSFTDRVTGSSREEARRGVARVRQAGGKVYLFSLDPGPLPDNQSQGFYGHLIYSQAEITRDEDKNDLLSWFVAGIPNGYGESIANWFNPRHGLRIVTSSNTVDF